MILFSSDLELILENKIIMNKLIIDAAGEKISLMIITNNDIYNITKENTKINYEKLTLIINDFLKSHQLNLKDINKIYFSEHHLSHAASAFYPSPFKEAVILTLDGVGEWATTTVAKGNENNLDMLKEIQTSNPVLKMLPRSITTTYDKKKKKNIFEHIYFGIWGPRFPIPDQRIRFRVRFFA